MGSNKDALGVGSIVIGLLLVIGAMRGTWQKLFSDVIIGTSSGPTPADISASVAAQGAQQNPNWYPGGVIPPLGSPNVIPIGGPPVPSSVPVGTVPQGAQYVATF